MLEPIKKRYTVRKYIEKPIPNIIVREIVDAGRWGPSVHGFQPWRFIVVTKTSLIEEIAVILMEKSQELGSGIDRFLSLTSRTIANAPCIILIYNTNILREVSLKLYKINRKYIKIAELSEVQAISAAIHNMILMAYQRGIGSCWNTIPIFCEKKINKLVDCNDQLMAILTMGYPAEKGKRASRKSSKTVAEYIS